MIAVHAIQRPSDLLADWYYCAEDGKVHALPTVNLQRPAYSITHFKRGEIVVLDRAYTTTCGVTRNQIGLYNANDIRCEQGCGSPTRLAQR